MRFGGGKLHTRQDREPDVVKDLSDQARADDFCGSAASEARAGFRAGWRDGQHGEVAHEIEDVPQVVAPAERGDGFVENLFQVLGAQAVRPKQSNVQM